MKSCDRRPIVETEVPELLPEIDRRSNAQHKRIAIRRRRIPAWGDDVLRVEFQVQPRGRLPSIPGFRHVFVALHIAGADAQGVGQDLRIGDIRIDVRRADRDPKSILGPPGSETILDDPQKT